MPHHQLLGHVVTLPVRRFGPPGAFLALRADDRGPDGPTVLLPGSEVPEGTRPGDDLAVFIYLDSEDRPVATLRAPRLLLGEVAFLKVTDVAPFGVFVDWGLPKELLVPHAERTREVQVGERHPVGLYLDDSGRLAGTHRVTEMLRGTRQRPFELDEWVEGEAWRSSPEIGIFVILERRFVGLLPVSEPSTLSRGDAASFRVASVLDDGKIELSLRRHGHEEVEGDAEKILAVLSRPGAPRVGDASTPEQLRAIFGISKKAFKRAVGRLLRERVVAIDRDGFWVPVRR